MSDKPPRYSGVRDPSSRVAAAIAKTSTGAAVAQDTTVAFVGTVAQPSPLRVDVGGVASACAKLSTVPALVGGDRVLVIRASGQAGALVCVGKVVAS